MRKILFKAKRIDNGEWVEGHLFCRKYFGRNEIFEAHIIQDAYEQFGIQNFGMQPVLISPVTVDETDGCYRVDINTICQYTGLTDKNGNKIWENDILNIPLFKNPILTVKFIEGAFCLADEKEEYVADIHYIAHAGIKQAEVIGNIFYNPELLKGE